MTKDPEIRATENTTIAMYSLAVDRKFKRDGEPTADFITCKAFGNGGEFAEKYLHKGIKIAVTGRIQTGSYTDKDGKKVYTTEVVVEEHEFAESKGNATQNAAQPTDEFTNIPEGIDELPFN